MEHISADAMEGYYEAYVGEAKAKYYVKRFSRFDQQDEKICVSWNWPALFVPGLWFLYRKMYRFFFGVVGLFLLISFISKLAPEVAAVMSVMPFIINILAALYGNSLYHHHVRRVVSDVRSKLRDPAKIEEKLVEKGGVHRWVIWLFILIPLLGILAAIILPAFIPYRASHSETKVEPGKFEGSAAQFQTDSQSGIASYEEMDDFRLSYEKASVEERFQYWKKETESVNATLPSQIDDITIFTKMTPHDNGVTYHYDLTEEFTRDKTDADWQQLGLKIKEGLMANFCTQEDLALYRTINAVMQYEYRDTGGTQLISFSFLSRDDCASM